MWTADRQTDRHYKAISRFYKSYERTYERHNLRSTKYIIIDVQILKSVTLH